MKLISVEKAILNIVSNISEIKKSEKVKLIDSLGRILSKSVNSKRNNPNQNVSAMDGFAVKKNNLKNRFKIIGEAKAGSPFNGKIKNDETVQIFTGAFVPKGANTVVIQENVSYVNDSEIMSLINLKSGQHIRKKGVDLKIGQIVAKKNTS